MSAILWWTGLVFWIVTGVVGACVVFIIVVGSIRDVLTERLERSGRMTSALVFLSTWAYRKRGTEIMEAAECALARHRDRIRGEVEKDVREEMADELDAIEDQLCRERARTSAYSDLLDSVIQAPTKEQMDKLGESTERYYWAEKAILADREKETKP